MGNPETTFVHLKEGESLTVGDTTVQRDPRGGHFVSSPGGMDGRPRTDRVVGKVFGIEQVSFDKNGDPVRDITLFEVV